MTETVPAAPSAALAGLSAALPHASNSKASSQSDPSEEDQRHAADPPGDPKGTDEVWVHSRDQFQQHGNHGEDKASRDRGVGGEWPRERHRPDVVEQLLLRPARQVDGHAVPEHRPARSLRKCSDPLAAKPAMWNGDLNPLENETLLQLPGLMVKEGDLLLGDDDHGVV